MDNINKTPLTPCKNKIADHFPTGEIKKIRIQEACLDDIFTIYKLTELRGAWVGEWDDQDIYWIAREGTRIISTVRIKFYKKGCFMNNEHWIFNLWVDPEYRGNKLGLAMIQDSLRHYKYSNLFLECAPYLKKYWSHLGFCPRNITKSQMSVFNVDDSIMTLSNNVKCQKCKTEIVEGETYCSICAGKVLIAKVKTVAVNRQKLEEEFNKERPKVLPAKKARLDLYYKAAFLWLCDKIGSEE